MVFYLGNQLLLSFSFTFFYLNSWKHCRFICCYYLQFLTKDVLFIFSANKVAAVGTSGRERCEGCPLTQFKHLPPQLALKLSPVRLLLTMRRILLRLQLHGAIYRPDSFVLVLRYCVSLKAIRYESTSLNRIVADKSHRIIVAWSYNYTMRFIGYDSIQTRWFISYRFQIHTIT